MVKICFVQLTPIYDLLTLKLLKKSRKEDREMMAFLSGLKRELSVTDLSID